MKFRSVEQLAGLEVVDLQYCYALEEAVQELVVKEAVTQAWLSRHLHSIVYL